MDFVDSLQRKLKFQTSPKVVLKSCGPLLVPFFKTVAIFFVLFPEAESRGTIWYAIFKCAPLVTLIAFVLLHGMSLSEWHSYQRRVVAGLVFSALGDAFLVFKGYFMHGLIMFAIAHLLYMTAFGFRPIKLQRLAFLGPLAAAIYLILLPGLNGPFVWATGVYLTLIITMMWRAVGRVEFCDGLWTWTSMCSFLGALLFCISDLLLAVDKFRVNIPYGGVLIMVTYYSAQCGIALSVVDNQLDRVLELSTRQTPHTEVMEAPSPPGSPRLSHSLYARLEDPAEDPAEEAEMEEDVDMNLRQRTMVVQ